MNSKCKFHIYLEISTETSCNFCDFLFFMSLPSKSQCQGCDVTGGNHSTDRHTNMGCIDIGHAKWQGKTWAKLSAQSRLTVPRFGFIN